MPSVINCSVSSRGNGRVLQLGNIFFLHLAFCCVDVEAALGDFLRISIRTTFGRLFLYDCFLYSTVVFNPSRAAAVILRPNPTCVGSTLRGKE